VRIPFFRDVAPEKLRTLCIATALWLVLFMLIWTVNSLGLWAFAVAVVVVYVLAVSLVVVAAMTWRREEVMAKQ
jgi:hypothetical protein